MSDDHEQRLPQPERLSHLDEVLLDSTPTNLGTPWVDVMNREERERQVEKRLPESGVIATWVILIGMAVLVVLACVLSVR
jgi:hypothetical protein